jgi:hypothetical protein
MLNFFGDTGGVKMSTGYLVYGKLLNILPSVFGTLILHHKKNPTEVGSDFNLSDNVYPF